MNTIILHTYYYVKKMSTRVKRERVTSYTFLKLFQRQQVDLNEISWKIFLFLISALREDIVTKTSDDFNIYPNS